MEARYIHTLGPDVCLSLGEAARLFIDVHTLHFRFSHHAPFELLFLKCAAGRRERFRLHGNLQKENKQFLGT